MSFLLGPSTDAQLSKVEANLAHFADGTADHTKDDALVLTTSQTLLKEGRKYLTKKDSYGDVNRDRLINLVDQLVSAQRADGSGLVLFQNVSHEETFKDLTMEQLLIHLGEDVSHRSLVTVEEDGRFPVARGSEHMANQALRIYSAARNALINIPVETQKLLDAKAASVLSALGNIEGGFRSCGPQIQDHILKTDSFFESLIEELVTYGKYTNAFELMERRAALTGKDFKDISKDLLAHVKTEIQADRLPGDFPFLYCGAQAHDLALVDDDFFEAAITSFSTTQRNGDALKLIATRARLTGDQPAEVVPRARILTLITNLIILETLGGDKPHPVTDHYRENFWRALPFVTSMFTDAAKDLPADLASTSASNIISTYQGMGWHPTAELDAFVAALDDTVFTACLQKADGETFDFLLASPSIKARIEDLIKDNFEAFSEVVTKSITRADELISMHPDGHYTRDHKRHLLMQQVFRIMRTEGGEERSAREAIDLFGEEALSEVLNNATKLNILTGTGELISNILLKLVKEMTPDELNRFLDKEEHGALRKLVVRQLPVMCHILNTRNLSAMNLLFQRFIFIDINNRTLYPQKADLERHARDFHASFVGLTKADEGMPDPVELLSEDDRITLYKNLQQSFYASNRDISARDINDWVYNMIRFFEGVEDNESVNTFFNPERLALDHISGLIDVIKNKRADNEDSVTAALALSDAYLELVDEDYHTELLKAQLYLQIEEEDEYEKEILAAFDRAYYLCEEGSDEEIRLASAVIQIFGASNFENKDRYLEVLTDARSEKTTSEMEELTLQANDVLAFNFFPEKFTSKFS